MKKQCGKLRKMSLAQQWYRSMTVYNTNIKPSIWSGDPLLQCNLQKGQKSAVTRGVGKVGDWCLQQFRFGKYASSRWLPPLHSFCFPCDLRSFQVQHNTAQHILHGHVQMLKTEVEQKEVEFGYSSCCLC